MEYFKLKVGQFLQELEGQEHEIDNYIKKQKKVLKKFTKLATDKKNETIIDQLIKLEASSPDPLSISRRKLKELNSSRSESEKIKIPVLDVGEIMKHQRRTLNRSRNTTFIINKSIRADTMDNKSTSKNDSNLQNSNETFVLQRDFVTPDNDTPMMELKRKKIEEELTRSVTMRKPLRKFQTREGTPVVGETNTETSVVAQSPTNNTPKPRRLVTLRKELEEIADDESESTFEFPKIGPIKIDFDDLHSDDGADSDDENLDIYPAWSKNVLQQGRVQHLVNPDLLDGFFIQELDINPKELFPNTSLKKMKRRRSSIMWNESE